MNIRLSAIPLILGLVFNANLFAQETEEFEVKPFEQVLSQEGYDRVSPAIVKIVADGGKRIGGGVILGVHKDNVGFILTTYSMVAGRNKVAVILKNYSDALLGQVVEQYIDFDLDLAVLAIKDFPEDQVVIKLAEPNKVEIGDVLTTISHTDDGDWIPIPSELNNLDDINLILGVNQNSGYSGTPIVDKNGNMLAIITGDEAINTSAIPLVSGVRTDILKPILNEWFERLEMSQKWKTQGFFIPVWMMAVGGGVLGGAVATVIAVNNGDGGGSRGLSAPPAPPVAPTIGQ